MYQAETKTVSISGSFLFDIEIEFVAKFLYFLCKYWQSHTNGICNLVNLAKIILEVQLRSEWQTISGENKLCQLASLSHPIINPDLLSIPQIAVLLW